MDYSETSTHTTSTSGSSYSAAAPLRNVQFDPSTAGVIEEQQQKIKHLQEQLAEFNRVRYRTLPANASRGKNVVPILKRVSLTATDLDKVTPLDIAYTVLAYKNSKEVWKEELQIRVNSKTDDERKKTMWKQKPKYHEGRGKRLQRYRDGWTDNGREYYQELLGILE